MIITVVHGGYGCDTGCCGHWVEVDGQNLRGINGFVFAHLDVGEDVKDFVRHIVTKACGPEHVADIDWDHCIVSDGRDC